MKIAVVCGSPSPERGISLNSSRSVLDHLEGDGIEIVPVYLDIEGRPYKISRAQLYSNTPSDFDFKLQTTAKPLTRAAFIKVLKSVDLVFPVMHGSYGEGGEFQSLLEKHRIPFVGSSAESCARAFDKYLANEAIKKGGFFALPSMVIDGRITPKTKRAVATFFTKHTLTRAIVKPAQGGSSIGVFSVNSVEEALEKVSYLFSEGGFSRVVIEPFAEGREFTVIILQNKFNLPVAILPTEIETDYKDHQIFDYRKKYLPTRQVTYHCPPRFDDATIESIQVMAEQLFSLFGMRDFARFDGWVFPDGKIWFSDFNPISGMEQNSFLFQQSSRVGMSHQDVLRYIVSHALQRYGRSLPSRKAKSAAIRKRVNVLFGDRTSERQVSLMSGTNVWLKLRKSPRYEPHPYLLGFDGDVWQLPYALTLNHTVEEILQNCEAAERDNNRLSHLVQYVHKRLALSPGEANAPFFLPKKLSLEEFFNSSSFVFLALLGGQGEDGTLQAELAKRGVKFNGPSSKVSRLCADKWETTKTVRNLNIPGVTTARGEVLSMQELPQITGDMCEVIWRELLEKLGSPTVIVKPRGDGCSSGIVRLFSGEELRRYLEIASARAPRIPPNTFTNQRDSLEMPLDQIQSLLFEEFIETDHVRVSGNELIHHLKSGWIEVTVGVVQRGRHLKVFNPSLTVAEGEVLSLEEKFQGGTGVNITPPPESVVTRRAKEHAMYLIGRVATGLGIEGYSRIDAFLECKTGNVKIIEVNTLPGLTPSTVFYHQALAEKPPMFPREVLEQLIENKWY